MPHDIASRTARIAVGVGISPHQATALMISSVFANFGGDMDKVALSLTSSKRISTTVNDDADIIPTHLYCIKKQSIMVLSFEPSAFFQGQSFEKKTTRIFGHDDHALIVAQDAEGWRIIFVKKA